MKNILILNIIISLSIFSNGILLADGLSEQIQEKIHEAFSKSIRESSPKYLDQIITGLKDQDNRESKYWQAYAIFKSSIYYVSKKDKDKAEEEIEKAIEVLDNIKKKTSEDHALLSACIGFSIQFSPFKAPFLGSKASSHAEKAIKLDENNIRGYLALARGDYYKPKMFGGGDLVEETILTALTKPEKGSIGTVPPSWGKNELYLILSQFYKREKRKTEAIMYCKKGLNEFKNDFQLKAMAKTLKIED